MRLSGEHVDKKGAQYKRQTCVDWFFSLILRQDVPTFIVIAQADEGRPGMCLWLS